MSVVLYSWKPSVQVVKIGTCCRSCGFALLQGGELDTRKWCGGCQEAWGICRGFASNHGWGNAVIGPKYLTSGSVEDTRNAVSLEDARSGMAWLERLIDNLQSEKKEGAIARDAGSPITTRNVSPSKSAFEQRSCPVILRRLIQDRRPSLEEPSRSGGSKTVQETWGRSRVLGILSVRTLLTDNTSVVHLSSKSRTLEEIRR